MAIKGKQKLTELVKVSKSVKTKVEKAIAGTPQTIGGYYDLAAEQLLNNDASVQFSRNDLVAFGQYLFSAERKNSIKQGINYKNLGKLAFTEIHHADIENFLATR